MKNIVKESFFNKHKLLHTAIFKNSLTPEQRLVIASSCTSFVL